MLKTDKMFSYGVSICISHADKNSSMTALVTIIMLLSLITAYLIPVAYLVKYIRWWSILRTLTYSEVYSGYPRHLQGYSAIFSHGKPYWGRWRHIQAYSEPCVILTHKEIWHTWNPWIFRNLPLLNPNTYSEPCHIYENS